MCITWVFLLVAVHIHGKEESEEMKKCIKERRRGLVSIKKSIGLCETLTKSSTGTQNESAFRGCLAKCVFKQENVLGDNDAIIIESFENGIENRVSGGQRKLLLKALDECLQKHGSLVKPDDPTCPGYLEVGVCLQVAIGSLCEDPIALLSGTNADDPKEEL